jgi:hypothetical protein
MYVEDEYAAFVVASILDSGHELFSFFRVKSGLEGYRECPSFSLTSVQD